MVEANRIRLLIGHDGSSSADTAAVAAAHLFRGSSAVVLHVSKSIADWGMGSHVWILDTEIYDQAVLEAAQARLDVAAAGARAAGLEVEALLRTTGGSVWRTILATAEEVRPDLIVVGKHAHGNFGSARLGSVAHGLVSRSSWPVLVVRPQDEPAATFDGPVVIAYDGSAGARRIVDVVAGLMPGAPTVIVSVWEPIPPWIVAPPLGPPTFHADLDQELSQVARERAAEGVELATAAGLQPEPVTIEAQQGTWRAIVQLAVDRSARVLCIGTHARGRIAAALLGSVARAVVSESPVPVLIAHPEPVSDADDT